MEQNLPDRFDILQLMRDYQPACVLGAAAELNLFTLLGDRSRSAAELAEEAAADRRAMAMLLDALTALRLLEKTGQRYATPAPLRPLLTERGPQTVLPMIWHSMTCLRQWTRLAWVVKRGLPDPRQASIRGDEADRAAFIAAMHSVSGPMADGLVARLGDLPFRHLLDVGGASGTWTLAFLRAGPARLPRSSICRTPSPRPEQRLAGSELEGRVTLVAGDFYADELARRGRSRLGQRDRPSALAGAQPGALQQGLSRLAARRTDRHPRHRHAGRSHAAARGRDVRHQHAGQHGDRRDVYACRVCRGPCSGRLCRACVAVGRRGGDGRGDEFRGGGQEGIGPANQKVGDCPNSRPTKMGLSPCEIGRNPMHGELYPP